MRFSNNWLTAARREAMNCAKHEHQMIFFNCASAMRVRGVASGMNMPSTVFLMVILLLFLLVLCNGHNDNGAHSYGGDTIGLKTNPTPIVFWHGLGSSSDRLVTQAYMKRPVFFEEHLKGVYFKKLKIGHGVHEEVEKGFFMDCNQQVRMACEQIRNDPKLQNGYHAVGMSQGGLFLRAVAQRCPDPPMLNLVTISSPHQGVYGLPLCPGENATHCNLARKLITQGAYSDLVQRTVVQAQYWHDPRHEDTYRLKSLFLADINNEREPRNREYAKTLNKVKHFVMIYSSEDTFVGPNVSERFGWYVPGQANLTQNMNETRLYKEDFIGLRKLDEAGKVKFYEVGGQHGAGHEDFFVSEIIPKYLISLAVRKWGHIDMTETNRKRLFQLLDKPENRVCADCDFKGPDWGSHNIGVFLCNACASVHRSLGSHISRVKSVKLDNWDRTQVSCMEEIGNGKAHEMYEKFVPAYYRRPKHDDAQMFREQWIRAKYERKEFAQSPLEAAYGKGDMQGILMKRGKKDGKFQPRMFYLNHNDGELKYIVKQNDKKPKATIKIVNLNVSFCEKIPRFGLQLTYLKDGATRSIFVFNDKQKTTVDWFTAIRATKLKHMQIAFPTTPPEELAEYLTRDFVIEGYLWKTGPRSGDAYRKRYFVLDYRKLMYLDDCYDAYPKGEIFLGEKSEGYSVKCGIDNNLKLHEYGFMLITPERSFLLGALSDDDRNAWVAAIGKVIEKPPAPQDYSVNLRTDLRNSYSYKKNRGSGGSDGRSSGSSGGTGSRSTFGSTLTKKGKTLFDRVSSPFS